MALFMVAYKSFYAFVSKLISLVPISTLRNEIDRGSKYVIIVILPLCTGNSKEIKRIAQWAGRVDYNSEVVKKVNISTL